MFSSILTLIMALRLYGAPPKI